MSDSRGPGLRRWIRGWPFQAVALLSGAVLWSTVAVAQVTDPAVPVQELTADQSVSLGLEQSARVRAAEADAAVAAARAREARAGLLPAVRAQASGMRIGGDIPDAEFTLPGLDTTITLLPIVRNPVHGEVSLEQPLFAGGRLRAGLRAAERELAAAEWGAEEARADVALEVRQAYWTLHGALAGLEATEAALAQVEEHLREVRRRFEEGALLRSDVLAAETRRSEVLLERVETANAVRVARLELGRLLGLPAGTEVVPTTQVAVLPLPPGPDALAEQAIAGRPELRALEEQVAALRAQEAAARGGRLPEVAFVSRYIYARPNPYAFVDVDEFRGTWEAGVSLRWGIWEGGAQGARATQALEQRRAAEARLVEARDLARVDVARRYLEAERAAEALGVAAQVVEHAAESLRVVRQQFAEGAAMSSQVLEAEAVYRQARARQARAQAEHAIGRAALLRALGEV
jgi:outer membrane protein